MIKREFFRAGFQPSVNISNDVNTGIPQTAKSSDVTDLGDIFPARNFFWVGYANLTVGPM
jgi:hypothetical protein